MINISMQEKLERGEAIDISSCTQNAEGDYLLKDFEDGKDYCDAKNECWIWSIGKHNVYKTILASTTTKFYQNPSYRCLFLR